jgi:uncharacterized protein
MSMSEDVKSDRMWAMFCHLAALCGYFLPVIGNILGPFLVWIAKRDQSAFIDQQGKEALNFQLTVSIALLVAVMLMVVVIGIFLLPLIALVDFILIVIAAASAYKGENFRYPFCLRFIR